MLAIEHEVAEYYDLIKPKYLKWKFIQPYTKLEPKFGTLGLVVYYRTYSRYIKELNRRESWWEMILRVVEYSMSLYPTSKLPNSFEDWLLNPKREEDLNYNNRLHTLEEEAKDLFDHIFHMKVFPAGRTMWVGGTDVVKAAAEANFNCSFTTINLIKSYVDMFHLLLVGAGTGFSIEQKYVADLPTFNSKIEVSHKEYEAVARDKRLEKTEINIEYVDLESYDCRAVIHVGDSKKGWESALEAFLVAASNDYAQIHFVYDNVRPAGERLKTMGGRASGPGPLRMMFEEITDIITSSNGKLDGVQAMDIANSIAKAVVVGGVRRSSQIALGDVGDQHFITAKANLWDDPAKAQYTSTRVMSNNSLMFWHKPSKDKLTEVFRYIKTNGEPGFINAAAASKRRPNFKGVNPCAEILLDNFGLCNLAEINVRAFVLGPNKFDYAGFKQAIRLATRMGSRITNVTLWDPQWDEVQKRDRLLGVSLTGQVEAWDALGWGYVIDDVEHWAHKFLRIPFFANNPKPPEYMYLKDERITNVLSLGRGVAREEADLYHEEMGIPRSLLVTTVKPSGTISQLPGVSSGVHRPYSPYYMRNIRVSKNDPVAKALRFLEVPVHPENNQGENLDGEGCNTWVFTFPVKTDAPIRSIDEPAVNQLERYKQVMDNYVEHNCSVTISVGEDEWDDVVEWLYKDENWDSFVGVSFIPRFDAESAPYPQMPYISTTKSQYLDACSKLESFTEEEFQALIAMFEKEYEDYDLGSDCTASGFCPVR